MKTNQINSTYSANLDASFRLERFDSGQSHHQQSNVNTAVKFIGIRPRVLFTFDC